MQWAWRTINRTEGDSWKLSSTNDKLMDMTDLVEICIVGPWEVEKGSKTK